MVAFIKTLPMYIAPLIMVIFIMVSAYVLKFKVRGDGLGFDYIIFTIVIVLALKFGGAI